MNYNFPLFKAYPFSALYQVRKIKTEAQEAIAADTERDQIEEVLDVLHACETYLRNKPQSVVNDIRNEVIEKNQRRGYYNAKTE